ncbi:MAG: RluA family pseudouridine synthase [Burkholderiales bacterium]|nr:RluA family pseudouridine synthase [Burkholderiales bacterium]
MAWQGMRLDRALALWQPDSSRSHLQQLVEEGALQIDGEPCLQASRKLRLGQRLLLAWRAPDAMLAFVAEPMELPIVHEDVHLLVIDKPAGLVVHPAAGNWRGTLMNGLLAHHAGAVQLPRAGIVHRLDKDTSGLMVVAKTQVAYDLLVAQLAAREVRREYLALVKGAWGEPRCVDAPVGRDPRQRVRMAVVGEARGGKPAQTDIEALAQTARACLLHCSLRTGRTHQIRVHCAHAGHPLYGDTLYGGPPLSGLQRQALHAARLTLRHPQDGRTVQWVSPPHEDFHQAAAALGLDLSWP